MTVQDLRDVLREQAEGPSPANPARHEQVGAHIRRIRRRRRVVGGAAAGVAAAAVLFGAWLVPGAADQPQKATVAASIAKLPERFTAPDGTEYRRVATTAIEATGDRKAVVTVPLSGKPLDVAGVCEGADNSSLRVSAGARTSLDRLQRVHEGHAAPSAARAGNTGEVTVTFDTTTRGTGCVQVRIGRPLPAGGAGARRLVPGRVRVDATRRAGRAGPDQDLPRRLGNWKLTDSKTGLWPRDTTARFEIVGTGRKLAFDQICGGDLARRLLVHTATDLTDSQQSTTCSEWKNGPFPMAMTELPAVPKGKRVVVTVRISVLGEATNRPIRWSFGLYSK